MIVSGAGDRALGAGCHRRDDREGMRAAVEGVAQIEGVVLRRADEFCRPARLGAQVGGEGVDAAAAVDQRRMPHGEPIGIVVHNSRSLHHLGTAGEYKKTDDEEQALHGAMLASRPVIGNRRPASLMKINRLEEREGGASFTAELKKLGGDFPAASVGEDLGEGTLKVVQRRRTGHHRR